MRKDELERTLLGGSRMTEDFFPTRIFSRIGNEQEVGIYWEERGLEVTDWKALTAFLLTEVFSQDFLTPLTETDVAFPLHVRANENISWITMNYNLTFILLSSDEFRAESGFSGILNQEHRRRPMEWRRSFDAVEN